MRILFFAYGKGCDYQGTLLLHGLYQIKDLEVFIQEDVPWLFTDYEGDIKKLYGKGVNITKLVDPSRRRIHTKAEIENGLKSHWYDLVIYGSTWIQTPMLDLTLKYYKKNEIFFIDGADEDFGLRKNYISLNGLFDPMLPIWYIPVKQRKRALDLSSKGTYFKREISDKYKRFFIPISFAYPEQLFCDEKSLLEKHLMMATIYPGRTETYIYEDAESYNKGYQEARFGTTFKKAGWDCYRHYEILANGCIPYFPNIEKCPDKTMFLFPKNIIKITNDLYVKWKEEGFEDSSEQVYEYYQRLLYKYAKLFLTTKSLAEYVIGFWEE